MGNKTRVSLVTANNLGMVLSFRRMNLFFGKQKGTASSVAEPAQRPPLKPGQFYCCKCGCPTYYELHKPFCSAECRFNLTGTANYPEDKKSRGKRRDEQHHFYFHVHGTTQGDRQAAISRCVRREQLQFVREPENPYDKNAVRIRRLNGEDLGYVPRNNAAELAPKMDAGQQIRAEVDWLNAPAEDFHSFGLKVRVGLLNERKA